MICISSVRPRYDRGGFCHQEHCCSAPSREGHLTSQQKSPVPSIRSIDTVQTRAWPRSWCWCWWWAGRQIIALLLLLDVVTCCLCFLRPTVVSVVFVTADGILNRQFSNPMPLLPSRCCLWLLFGFPTRAGRAPVDRPILVNFTCHL